MNQQNILQRTTAELLAEKRKFHQVQVDFHQSQIDEIDKMTKLSRPKSGHKAHPKNGSAKQVEGRMKWSKPILKLLKEQNCLLKTTDIVNFLFTDIDDHTRSKYVMTASSALFGLGKRKKIKKYEVKGEKGDYYGLPEFFNGDIPKPEYQNRMIVWSHKT